MRSSRELKQRCWSCLSSLAECRDRIRQGGGWCCPDCCHPLGSEIQAALEGEVDRKIEATLKQAECARRRSETCPRDAEASKSATQKE
jgi:hypothetical protein